jgi:uncharacterized protein (DUF1778 family)
MPKQKTKTLKDKKEDTHQIYVRLNDDIYFHIEAAAKRVGLTVPQFCRMVITQKARETQ